MKYGLRRGAAIAGAIGHGVLQVVTLAGCSTPPGHDAGVDVAADVALDAPGDTSVEAGGDAANPLDADDVALNEAGLPSNFVSTPCDAGAADVLCFSTCYLSSDRCDGIPAGVYPCAVDCAPGGACAGQVPDASITGCSLTGLPDGAYQVGCIQC